MRGNHQGSPARSIKEVFQTFVESLENVTGWRKDFFANLGAAREGRPVCIMGNQGRVTLVREKAQSSMTTSSAKVTFSRAEQP